MSDASLTNGITIVHDFTTPKLNGLHTAQDDAADSPAIDSPATPVDNSVSPDVKIDVQSNDQEESDVRHEPLPMKLDRINDDDLSIVPQVATPANPGKHPCQQSDESQKDSCIPHKTLFQLSHQKAHRRLHRESCSRM